MLCRCALVVAFVLSFSGNSLAYVEWEIQCNSAQSQFEITVTVFNQYIQEGDVSGYELLFEQFAIGTCEAPEVFLIVPLHAPLTIAEYSFTRPAPETNQYYRFRVLMKKPDETVYDVGFPGAPSWIAVSCGEAVAVTGMLVSVDDFDKATIELCPGACDTWPCTYAVELGEIPEEQWRPLIGAGIAVDIYGRYIRYPMPGNGCLLAQYWLPTASEVCGSVGIQKESWGGLKVRFR